MQCPTPSSVTAQPPPSPKRASGLAGTEDFHTSFHTLHLLGTRRNHTHTDTSHMATLRHDNLVCSHLACGTKLRFDRFYASVPQHRGTMTHEIVCTPYRATTATIKTTETGRFYRPYNPPFRNRVGRNCKNALLRASSHACSTAHVPHRTTQHPPKPLRKPSDLNSSHRAASEAATSHSRRTHHNITNSGTAHKQT